MGRRDAYLSDVLVVLSDHDDDHYPQVIARLEAMGLKVAGFDADNGTVEGTIETAKVHALDQAEGVEYVRTVFVYIADYEESDPRDVKPAATD